MQILKGAPVAAAIRDEIKKELEGCETKPCLAIVRVGEKQEDLSYERSALKRQNCLYFRQTFQWMIFQQNLLP